MAYVIVNIGKPANSAWWAENLNRSVITAGFNAEEGDRGDVVLRSLDEGDWVLAYANGCGYVGVGQVLGPETYRLHPTLPPGTLSDHQHERGVHWIHAIQDVAQAVTIEKAGRQAPRQIKEVERDEALAETIISLVAARSEHASRSREGALAQPQYWGVAEAVRALGRPASVRDITDWLDQNYPENNNSDARDNAALLSVNDANRRHHDHGRKDFRSDRGNPKDVLIRLGRFKDVTYDLYDPLRDGVFDIQRNANGKFEVVQFTSGSIARALAEAEKQVAAEVPPPLAGDDGRVWELRSVALRRGQPKFRADLIEAYGSRCAITGCTVLDILEAAHIVPYRKGGERTHRMDNGLLLRSDVHSLFDLGRLWVDQDFKVHVDEGLWGTEYEALDGQSLRLPSDAAHQPRKEHLADQAAVARARDVR